jgi:hypothetical protein
MEQVRKGKVRERAEVLGPVAAEAVRDEVKAKAGTKVEVWVKARDDGAVAPAEVEAADAIARKGHHPRQSGG